MPKEDESWMIYDTYRPGGKYAYELEVNYSQRERLNLERNVGPYNRLTFSPMTTLRSNRQPTPYFGEHFTYYAEVSTAMVSEEPTSTSSLAAESERKKLYFDITLLEKDIWLLGRLKARADYDSTDYPTVNRYWQKATQNIELRNTFFDIFDYKLGHIHYYKQDGNGSPFAFENYEFSPYDQFTWGIDWDFWWSNFGMGVTYDLPTMDPFSVKYDLKMGMHCYNLVFSYRIIFRPEYRSEFGFTFDLTNSRWIEK